MVEPKNPLEAERMDIDDPAERQAFYDALIAQGALLVREERMRAVREGLIDEQGRAVRSLANAPDEGLSPARIAARRFMREHPTLMRLLAHSADPI